jgi:1-pyrroline-5-carboxylate dehydrogenase
MGQSSSGGAALHDGEWAHGFYCAPTVVTGVPFNHRLWKHEMLVPLVVFGKVDSLDEAMAQANDTVDGLTSGFYGTAGEAQ